MCVIVWFYTFFLEFLFTSKQIFFWYCNLNIIFYRKFTWLLRKPFLYHLRKIHILIQNFVFKVLFLSQKSITLMFLTKTLAFFYFFILCFSHIFFLTRKVVVHFLATFFWILTFFSIFKSSPVVAGCSIPKSFFCLYLVRKKFFSFHFDACSENRFPNENFVVFHVLFFVLLSLSWFQERCCFETVEKKSSKVLCREFDQKGGHFFDVESKVEFKVHMYIFARYFCLLFYFDERLLNF